MAAHHLAFKRALAAKVDFIIHVPTDQLLDPATIALMATQHIIPVPTLVMMEKAVKIFKTREGTSFANAQANVLVMHKAGIPILAGTDCNGQPGSPAQIKHGESLHRELALLVGSGMGTLDVLRVATSIPAKLLGWGIKERLRWGRGRI